MTTAPIRSQHRYLDAVEKVYRVFPPAVAEVLVDHIQGSRWLRPVFGPCSLTEQLIAEIEAVPERVA